MTKKNLHIVIFDGSFATTAFIRRLIKGLVKNGLRVSVIGFNEKDPKTIDCVTYKSLGSNQSKLKFIKTNLGLAVQTGNVKTIVKTVKLVAKGKRKKLQKQNLSIVLKQLQPDIVHVQWPSLLPWLEPYFQNKNFKIILSQRGFHTNVRPFVKRDNFDYLRQCYPELDGLHSVSKAISKVGQQIEKPHTGIDEVVYTGLNLEEIPYQKRQNREAALQILSVGRPHWKKDYPTAVKACAKLKQDGVDFHYTIIGGQGDEEVLFLIYELGLTKHITLTGRMPQTEVYKKMQEADVFLLPSIEEGIANVAVEAMAFGAPVISTNCGGMEELITHKENGWIVPTRNPKAMAEALSHVNQFSLTEINRVTQNARKKVKEQHTEEKMVQDMVDLYEKVVRV